MTPLDWILFLGFIAYVVWDGTRRAKGTRNANDYFLAGRSVPWWAMGLSIMATQASAITMIGTTGQGWVDGMRFVQFYFALPLAMLIIAFTAAPAYHRLGVSTAYEYLGLRFDGKTRILSAVLFLFLRGLSVGFVIYAPSLVLSKVFHLPLGVTIVIMGGIAVAYTAVGGLKAVISTDVKQMSVMVIGLLVALTMLISKLPQDVGLSGALRIAGATGRLDWVDLGWNPAEKYTLWSSLIGGLFLFLSYFGTDQSQVQRLLSGRSLKHVRGALALNALSKVPFQFAVLLCGALLFVFYTFHEQPISFDPTTSTRVAELSTADRDSHDALVQRYEEARFELQQAARSLVAISEPANEAEARQRVDRAAARTFELRREAADLRGATSDTNYVFLDFILNYLPIGVIGLLLAAIFAAALSSIDSELNAMATVAVLDVYGFALGKKPQGPALVRVSRWATLGVGVFATIFALYAGEIGSLIEAVNRVGSYVYGSLLGAFVLAIGVPRANGNGAFFGLLIGMIAVGAAAQTDLAFLYLNTVGTVVVVLSGWIISLATGGNEPT